MNRLCRCTSYPLSFLFFFFFFFLGGGGGGGGRQCTLFLLDGGGGGVGGGVGGGGVGGGGRVHSAQGTTQFVDHKLTRIIQKELQSLIKHFVRS